MSELGWSAIIAFSSAALGIWAGHWLTTGYDRKRDRLVALIELDRVFRRENFPRDGGSFARDLNTQADLILYSVQTQDANLWEPILGFTAGITELRDQFGELIPAISDPRWKDHSEEIKRISGLIAMAKAKAAIAYVRKTRAQKIWNRMKSWLIKIAARWSKPKPNE